MTKTEMDEIRDRMAEENANSILSYDLARDEDELNIYRNGREFGFRDGFDASRKIEDERVGKLVEALEFYADTERNASFEDWAEEWE